MRLHRIENPISVDEELIAGLLRNGAETVVIQFSKPSAYDRGLLTDVNRACERFEARLNVRFYGHYGAEFDLRNLLYIPSVRSLNVDCLHHASHVEALSTLEVLEEFAFGVFEADVPHLLDVSALHRVRRLVLAETRKNNIDLSPLVSYDRLETLFLNGHNRHIEVLPKLASLRELSLSGMGKSERMEFISAIPGLRSLTYLLGGRDRSLGFVHPTLQDLELLRIRGLAEIDLQQFPDLERLRIEDQLQLRALDVGDLKKLRTLTIFNCKNLAELPRLESCQLLESLWIGTTAVPPQTILGRIPASLRKLSIPQGGTKNKQKLQEQVAALGLEASPYVPTP